MLQTQASVLWRHVAQCVATEVTTAGCCSRLCLDSGCSWLLGNPSTLQTARFRVPEHCNQFFFVRSSRKCVRMSLCVLSDRPISTTIGETLFFSLNFWVRQHIPFRSWGENPRLTFVLERNFRYGLLFVWESVMSVVEYDRRPNMWRSILWAHGLWHRVVWYQGFGGTNCSHLGRVQDNAYVWGTEGLRGSNG